MLSPDALHEAIRPRGRAARIVAEGKRVGGGLLCIEAVGLEEQTTSRAELAAVLAAEQRV